MISNSLLFRAGILLSKLIPTGMPVPIVRGPLRGYRWITGAAAGPAKGLSIIFNLLETNQLRTAANLLSPNDICFDLGANVGLYTLLFAKHSKHVFSFEPLPRNIKFLYQTVALNQADNVTLVPWAVSNETGLLAFEEGDNVALGKLEKTGTQPVATVNLDKFAEKFNVMPTLIKIDVEGAELLVLQGCENVLSRKPRILLSTHGDEMKNRCVQFLKEKNYKNFVALNSSDFNTASEFVITS